MMTSAGKLDRDRQVARRRIDGTILDALRNLPTADVALALGIKVRGNKAMCFNGHDRQSPSFTIGKNKISWKCYGCGEYGDSIALVEKILGFDFKAACDWLCDRYGIGTPYARGKSRRVSAQKPPPIHSSASDTNSGTLGDPEIYSWLVSRCGPVTDPRGLAYLKSHGIPQSIAAAFGVVELRNTTRAYASLKSNWGADRIKKCGLSSNGRSLLWRGYCLIFPFKTDSQVTYLQIRCLEGNMKFVGPIGIEKPIYNSERLNKMPRNQPLHICEGIPDTLVLEGRGLAAIGILGANSFRREWVDVLIPFDLVGVPDGDDGGKRFRQCLTKEFHARSKSIRFVVLPDGEDACDVVSKVNDA
ncbi:CHC2 zinc finger domain-containing protein [Herbaspirillum sp. WGmk3]|uniref:CHC2 zinc finger domain-containing protein n=1 Tax=Herbaspirillum sp. WGmk3 TaxID=2919925 RepID=UPI002090EF25|nr:CHC2 zinc finger domain-containing protein [Herbaspirillum sp. WGmk3]MCO4856495.1 CHC2 zinc finger domain-containing protein [Herbaspirillum sp. WGmk3]